MALISPGERCKDLSSPGNMENIWLAGVITRRLTPFALFSQTCSSGFSSGLWGGRKNSRRRPFVLATYCWTFTL